MSRFKSSRNFLIIILEELLMKTTDNRDNELRNILGEIEGIIKEMDSDLTKYSQRRIYEKNYLI